MFFSNLFRMAVLSGFVALLLMSVGCASTQTQTPVMAPGRVVAEHFVPEQPSLRSARVEIDRAQFQAPVRDLQDEIIIWTYLHESDPHSEMDVSTLDFQLWESEARMIVLHHWYINDLLLGPQRGEVFYSEEFDTVKTWVKALENANDARARRLGHSNPRELMAQLRLRGLHIPSHWEQLARSMPVPVTGQNVAAESVAGLATALFVLAENPPVESSREYWRAQGVSYQNLALLLKFQHLHEVSPQPGEPPYPSARNRFGRAIGLCARLITTHLGEEINPLLMGRLTREHSVESFEWMRGNGVTDHSAAFDTALWIILGDQDDRDFTPENLDRCATVHFRWVREILPAQCESESGVDFEPLRVQARGILRQAEELAAQQAAAQ